MPANRPTDTVLERQLRQACAELTHRLRAGETCRAEDWLATHPELAAHVESALELVYAEFVLREQLGQQALPGTVPRGAGAGLRGAGAGAGFIACMSRRHPALH